jgi:hypothetical protein
MENKRLKRFNKELSLYSKNQFFTKIRELYVKDVVKSIPSAKKLLNKIKTTKKNVLYKSSEKTAKEVIQKYDVITPKKITIDEGINQRSITIDKSNIGDYNQGIHIVELYETQKENPNSYITHVVKFYTKTGLSHTKRISASRPIVGKYRKDIQKEINRKFLLDDYGSFWIVSEWINGNESNYKNVKGRYVVLTTTPYTKTLVNNAPINQSYKDNETETCVYDGFLKFFDSQDKKKKTIFNKLLKNKSKFAKEYTDETLQEICDFTESTLTIRDLVRGDDFNKVVRAKKARYNIQFLNTKFNHLDLMMHSYKNQVIELNDEKEYNIIKDKSPFYIEMFGELITTENKYKIKDDEFNIVYKKWKEAVNYNDYKVNINNDELKMIFDYDYSMHCFINNFEIKNDLYKEIDIEKAYFNYSNKNKNPNYHGVPSGSFVNLRCEESFTIDTFREQLKNKLIGFYQVKVLNIISHKEVFEKISIFNNETYVFTSAQIKEFSKYISFKFLNLSICPSVHIPFTEDFKTNKFYCKAVGLMMHESEFIAITLKPLVCDVNYYQIIKNEDFETYEHNGIIKIRNKKDIIKSCHHIGYYIHSYIKVLVFQQLLEVNIRDVFGIKLDSIVIKKDARINKILNGFHKTLKPGHIETLLKNENPGEEGFYVDDLDGFLTYRSQSGFYGAYYKTSNTELTFKRSFLPDYQMITHPVIFLGGKGGSGKTHSVLNHFQDVCFVSMCWNLTEGKKLEYPNIKTLSINRLVGDECEQEKVFNKILFFDEKTMWREEHTKKALKLYPHKIIIMAGDIDYNGFYYQCNVRNKVINPSELNLQYIKYIRNFRFDDKLNSILDTLRMTTNKNQLTNFINQYFTFTSIDKINYHEKCIGISDLDDNKNDNELTNYFIYKGAKPRYYIKNTNYKLGQYRGAIVDDITAHNNWEKKLFKTVHSYQGLDIKHDEILIISVVNYEAYPFDYAFRLIYTAVSRARRLDQIIFIKND